MKKNKQLMILERADAILTECQGCQDGVIRLSGVFTKFNVLNGNNRIYTPEGFLPKLQELLPAVASGALLGELDHPKNFDVSLQNASHVIEKLEYDEANQQVIGTIRLLNTDSGKNAQALVRDGIPLHISSRAAGNVDPATNKVILDKLFTYDLVATPGFSEAVLHRVNESYGYSNAGNVAMYEIDDDMLKETKSNKEYNNTIMSNMTDNHVTTKDFQRYTEYIGGVVGQLRESLDNLKSAIKGANPQAIPEKLERYLDHLADGINKTQEHSDYLAEQLERNINGGKGGSMLEKKVDALIKHNNYLAEQLEKSINYSEYVAENLNRTQIHGDYLAEQLEKGINYSEYVAENLDKAVKHNDYLVDNMNTMCKHNDYLAEQLEKSIAHGDYLAENLERTIKYGDYLAENLDKTCGHSDYLAEKLEQNFAHNDYLAEKLEQNFAHNDYLAEELQNNFAHNDYIAEELNKTNSYSAYLAESLDNTCRHSDYLAEQLEAGVNGRPLNEGKWSDASNITVDGRSNTTYMSSLDAKLDALVESVKSNIKEENFMDFLTEKKQREFNGLDDKTKSMITESMRGVRNAEQANAVWHRVYESKKGLDIIDNMPEQFRATWESLSDQRKNELLEEAKFYKLNTANEIAYFWQTRDMRERQQVVERLDTDSARMWNTEANMKEQNDYIGSIMGQVKRRMGC